MHELARQHVPTRSFNPSPTHVAFASSFTFHNNIYNVETIAWHIQKCQHQYEEYLRMFHDAQTTMLWLKSQSAKLEIDSLATISTSIILQIMIPFLFVTFCIFGEDIAKKFTTTYCN